MASTDPYIRLHEISRGMEIPTQQGDIEAALDQVEHLSEAIPPEMQDLAEPFIETLRKKLADCT